MCFCIIFFFKFYATTFGEIKMHTKWLYRGARISDALVSCGLLPLRKGG